VNFSSTKSGERARDLMHQYLDGRLDPKDMPELNESLRSSRELRHELAEFIVLEVQLRELGERQKLIPRACPTGSKAVLGKLQSLLGWRPPSFRWALTLAIGLAAVVLCWLLALPLGSAPIKARLARVEGRVTLERAGRQRLAAAGLDLRANDRLTLDRDAWTIVRYEDQASSFSIRGPADVSFQVSTNARRVVLRRGSLSATIPGAGAPSPIEFATAQAEAVGFGAEFTLAAEGDSTSLHVLAGRVRLRRAEDGATTDVTQGEFALARHGGSLAPTGSEPGDVNPLSGQRPQR
jgi:hypothetical protein